MYETLKNNVNWKFDVTDVSKSSILIWSFTPKISLISICLWILIVLLLFQDMQPSLLKPSSIGGWNFPPVRKQSMTKQTCFIYHDQWPPISSSLTNKILLKDIPQGSIWTNKLTCIKQIFDLIMHLCYKYEVQ